MNKRISVQLSKTSTSSMKCVSENFCLSGVNNKESITTIMPTWCLYIVAAPPKFEGDLKISEQYNWRGPEQKSKFGGDLKF